ncbi:hypothetical protein KAW80_02575 [Candidatus Babeliales bacterium]|nr:hypothetical protein [Candidatus Babeliales bacterium]
MNILKQMLFLILATFSLSTLFPGGNRYKHDKAVVKGYRSYKTPDRHQQMQDSRNLTRYLRKTSIGQPKAIDGQSFEIAKGLVRKFIRRSFGKNPSFRLSKKAFLGTLFLSMLITAPMAASATEAPVGSTCTFPDDEELGDYFLANGLLPWALVYQLAESTMTVEEVDEALLEWDRYIDDTSESLDEMVERSFGMEDAKRYFKETYCITN